KQKGKVVGARITTTLRPAGGHKIVEMVLGKPDSGKYNGQTYRQAAAGQTPGYVLHKEPKRTVTKDAEEITFTVQYDAKKGLVGGAAIDVTSVWAKGEKTSMIPGHADALHVWG